MRQILAYSAIVALSATPLFAESHSSAEEDTQSSTTMEETEGQTDTNTESDQESDTSTESGQETDTDAESGQESDTDAESGQESEMDTQATELSGEERDQLTAEQLLGKPVYDAEGNEVGDIAEVLMNEDGQNSEVVIEVGGFLGIGEKPVAVALEDLTISRSEGASGDLRIETTFTEEDLKNMPEWEA